MALGAEESKRNAAASASVERAGMSGGGEGGGGAGNSSSITGQGGGEAANGRVDNLPASTVKQAIAPKPHVASAIGLPARAEGFNRAYESVCDVPLYNRSEGGALLGGGAGGGVEGGVGPAGR